MDIVKSFPKQVVFGWYGSTSIRAESEKKLKPHRNYRDRVKLLEGKSEIHQHQQRCDWYHLDAQRLHVNNRTEYTTHAVAVNIERVDGKLTRVLYDSAKHIRRVDATSLDFIHSLVDFWGTFEFCISPGPRAVRRLEELKTFGREVLASRC